MEFFEIFGLPIGFNINQKELGRTYIQLQKKYHPDFFGQSSDEERAYSLEQSSQINKAYKIFKDPDQTIRYFLEQKELIKEGEGYKLPSDFLMEVMEINELKMDGAPQEQIIEKAREMEGILYNDIENILVTYNDQTATEKELLKIKDYYFKKKYIDRLLE